TPTPTSRSSPSINSARRRPPTSRGSSSAVWRSPPATATRMRRAWTKLWPSAPPPADGLQRGPRTGGGSTPPAPRPPRRRRAPAATSGPWPWSADGPTRAGRLRATGRHQIHSGAAAGEGSQTARPDRGGARARRLRRRARPPPPSCRGEGAARFATNTPEGHVMHALREVLAQAEAAGAAVGHFNVADLVLIKAVFAAARERNVPVLVGASEGEREFMGTGQLAALVRSLREEF